MGSKAGWKSVLTGGQSSAARQMARAQQQESMMQSMSQIQLANAIKTSSKAVPQAPKAVEATMEPVAKVAEREAQGAQKRRRTIASTVSRQGGGFGSILGG